MWDGANAGSTHTCRGGGGPQPVANWTVFASPSEGPGSTVHVCLCVLSLHRERERERERDAHHLNTMFLSMGEINEKASQYDWR